MNGKNQENAANDSIESAQIIEVLLSQIKSGSTESDLQNLIEQVRHLEKDPYPLLKERFRKCPEEEKKTVLKALSYINGSRYSSFLKDILLKQTPGLTILQSAFAEAKDLDIPEGEMIRASLPTALEIYEEIRQMVDAPLESLNIRFAVIKDCFIQLNNTVQRNLLYQFISDFKERSLPIISLLIRFSNELDSTIIELLSDLEIPETARLLGELMEKTGDREQKKRIKHALFKLKSKGVKAQEPEQKKNVWTPSPSSQTASWEGYLSAIDCTGTRLAWVISPLFPRGVNMAYAALNDAKGIVDFFWGEMSRKELKKYFNDYHEKEGENFAVVEAPSEYCMYLIEKHRKLMTETGKKPPEDYLFWKSIVKPKEVLDLKPLIYQDYQEKDREKILGLIDKTDKLSQIKEFSSWLVDPAEISPLVDSFEASSKGTALSPAEEKEKIEEMIKAITAGFFDEKKASLLKERLEETAYILQKTGRTEDAGLTLSAALAIEKKSVPLEDHPFLREMIRKSVELILDERKGKPGSSSTLNR
jgi:hypothetical protein